MDRTLSQHYRADIDGLRAIAVLGVVLFHLSPTTLTGGFVGVDIFFVISGYLITGHIRKALAEGDFSFLDFYAKRIRRLYPALVVTMLLTIAGAYFLLFPLELKHVSQAALAAAFYVSNYYYLFSIDYFSHNEIRPLLHTWSLAVEEQFYLVFPALLLALSRATRRTAALAILALAICSLAYAQFLVGNDSALAFYGAPTRFWEFAAGALLTYLPSPKQTARSVPAVAAFGLAAVIAAVVLMSETSPVPGPVALLPVLGAAAIIRAGESENRVSQLLAFAPLRYIGRISYALYLVHWPLIVFTKALYQLSLPHWLEAALLAASILLADLLTRFVERPFRALPLPSRRQFVYAAGAVSTAVIATVSVATISSDGFASRYPSQVRRMISYLDYETDASFRTGTCLLNAEAEREDDGFNAAMCLTRADDATPDVLLIGDSYAAQYQAALNRAFPHLALGQVSATGCRPLLHAEGTERCVSLMRWAFSRVIPNRHYAAIILSGRWKSAELPRLAQTVRFLSPYADQVYVFGPMVEYAQPLPRLLALQDIDLLDGDLDRDVVREGRYLAIAQQLDERMGDMFADFGGNVRYVSVLDELCDMRTCTTITPSGAPAQFDYGHLTTDGASLILHRLQNEGRLRTLRTARKIVRPPGRPAGSAPS